MEYIGSTSKKPSMKKNGKWNYIDVEFNTSDEFNEATSKMMNVLYKENGDGKCVVADTKGNKYLLELVHSTYDTINNIIRVFPYACKTLLNDKEKNTNKKQQ